MPKSPKRPCPKPYCSHLQPCPVHPTGWRKLAGQSKAQRGYGTKDWDAIRTRVLDRARWGCAFVGRGNVTRCGVTATHVDHIIPKAQGGTDDDANLQALCAHHHAIKTGKERKR